MRTDGEVIGAISLYRRLPRPLAVTLGDAQILADAVAGMLLEDPMADAAACGLAAGGWSSRSVVQQATGMVASQLRISVTDALAVLRSHAFATDSPLPDVARDVLDRRLDLSGS
jgi:ABC-type cobalamin transport system permease subunit